jgi:hypothetical protein
MRRFALIGITACAIAAACSTFESSPETPVVEGGAPDATVDGPDDDAGPACPRPGSLTCENFDDGQYAQRWHQVISGGLVDLAPSPISPPNAFVSHVFGAEAGVVEGGVLDGGGGGETPKATIERIVSRGAAKGIVLTFQIHMEKLPPNAYISVIGLSDPSARKSQIAVFATPGLTQVFAGTTEIPTVSTPFTTPDQPWFEIRLELDLVNGTGNVVCNGLTTPFKSIALPPDVFLTVGGVVQPANETIIMYDDIVVTPLD